MDGASRALLLFDGSTERHRLSDTSRGPAEVIIGLPAPTTFDRFLVPNVGESPGRPTMYRDISIEGSDGGPGGPWVELAAAALTADIDTAELPASSTGAVLWIRITLANGIETRPGTAATQLEFTEIIGFGTQEDQALSDGFSGTWDLRRLDQMDRSGEPITLRQTDTVVSGCYENLELHGTVDGAVARATGVDPTTGAVRSFLFVLGDDGALHSAVEGANGRILSRRGVATEELATCEPPPPTPPGCGSTVHIQFEADSAVLRPSSARVLAGLFEGLDSASAESITIVGHTSTEGSAAYNLDLSERRAQAVVNSLVARGFDPATISAEGRGELQPLVFPELDETARSLNRRVEVSCSS